MKAPKPAARLDHAAVPSGAAPVPAQPADGTTLTPCERLALAALQRAGPLRASSVGYLLWQASDPATRKAHPSAQGLALLAGRFLGTLYRRQLVFPSTEGWSISRAGRAVLASLPPGRG